MHRLLSSVGAFTRYPIRRGAVKVLLLGDVSKIGRKYDVKDVSDGYALNFLFPKGLAERATPERLRTIESERVRLESRKEAIEISLEVALQKDRKPILIEVASNDKGHLFAALHEKDIALALTKQCGIEITHERVILKEPIRELGLHSASVRVMKGDFPIAIEVAAPK